jgi:hypothetical protein
MEDTYRQFLAAQPAFDRNGHVHLDYTGAGLCAESQAIAGATCEVRPAGWGLPRTPAGTTSAWRRTCPRSSGPRQGHRI